MKTVGAQDGSEYAKLLAVDLNEPSILFRSFSINVTEFYRDKFVWDCLFTKIMPQMTQNGTQSLKIWSAGCASGEEPYGLAILLKEVIGQRKIRFVIKATDINPDALNLAREGKYHPASLKNMPPQTIAKYFVKTNDTYQVNDELKQLVSFEHADILSYEVNNVNFVSCRNVLIYYDKPTQELVFDKFSKVMVKNGYLVIGQDETMMGIESAKLFSCIYPRERFYTKV